MPITQSRMLKVLEENERLDAWTRSLHGDLLGVLYSPLDSAGKLEAISDLLLASPPACVQCAIERDHFRRAAGRNSRQAARMRRVRSAEQQQQEKANGLD